MKKILLVVALLFGLLTAASPVTADDTIPGDPRLAPDGCSSAYPWYKKANTWAKHVIWDNPIHNSGMSYDTLLSATTFYYRCKNSSGTPMVKPKKVQFCYTHVKAYGPIDSLDGARAFMHAAVFNPFWVADGVTTNPPTYTVEADGSLSECGTYDISATDERWLKPVCDEVPCARWKVTAWLDIDGGPNPEVIFKDSLGREVKFFPRDHRDDLSWG